MKKLENKTKLSTIALILVLTLSAILVALPAATAQDVRTKTSYAFIGAVPNPVGVNQQVLLHVGITDYLFIATDGWEGLTVTVVDPEGSESTLGPYRTDSTGGTGDVFTPTKIGTYTLQTNFPAQTYVWPDISRAPIPGGGPILFEASDSDILKLVVQEEQIEYHSGFSLPTEYWTRPIDAQLREWSRIAGNWVTTPPNRFAPYNDYAPETAHILWAKPLTKGGLVGGELGPHAYDCGDAYRGKWGWRATSVIIDGVLYYNRFPSTFTGPLMLQQGIIAVDLRTGEELWFRNNTILAFGQTMYWDSMNMHGAFAYLWETVGSTWNAYDAFTGEWAYTMENVPSGTRVHGPNGEILIYNINTKAGWMTLWNSSNVPALYGALDPEGPGRGFVYYSWMPEGKTVDATGPCLVTPRTPLGIAGYSWNVTMPAGLSGSIRAVFDDRVIGASITLEEVNSWGLSLKPGQEGILLFDNTWNAPAEWATGSLSISWVASSVEDGVFVLWAKETRKEYGFSTETGKFLWETEPEHYLNIYGKTSAIAYGKLYSSGCSGIVYCYDVTTGKRLWTYEANDPYQEFLWTNNWWSRILFITDGKIYLGHEEHSPIDPKPRGAPFTCLNVDDGSVVWKIDGAFRATHWGGNAIIGDSIIATMDTYDQRIYAIGKGPSATTVTASPKVSVYGSSVLIEGMVTDISPGTEDYALTARFPNGVPAVSDESMSDWMLYVYKQFPRPADATGVTVTLEAIDPNGNYVNLGTTTTDAYGNYGFAFEPEVEGKYMIIATFYGSGAYYGSTTITYLIVDPAPSPAGPIEPEPSAPLISTEGAIIAAVAIASIIGAVSFYILRKRK